MDSPFCALYHTQPELGYLKVFGTAVYQYIRPYISNKLLIRSVFNVFLGYSVGYKAIICYNFQNQKLMFSRHTVHDKKLFLEKSFEIFSVIALYTQFQ